MLTFKRESWESIRAIIYPLWLKHWNEIGTDREKIPLDPDWPRYDDLSAQGALHIIGARNENGDLVGYVFSIISPHLHYRSTRCAFFDLYWLDPAYRKGMNGVRLFRETEKSLRACGVCKVFGQTKVFKDMGMIFQRLGWTEAERVFKKVL
jgi:hypothetical protein